MDKLLKIFSIILKTVSIVMLFSYVFFKKYSFLLIIIYILFLIYYSVLERKVRINNK